MPIPGVWDANEASFHVARLLRAHDRLLDRAQVVQLPLIDGGAGTVDFLVTHTLGSFLEVEATSATGEETVAPIGFTGDDGKLSVIEMARTSAVGSAGDFGTTAGVGQLIRDALDEGAFSILLGHEEPLACDAGFGAAAALGVKFLDARGAEIPFEKPGAELSKVERIDLSGRSFGLLSSRLYLAQSSSARQSRPTQSLLQELGRLREIIQRDTTITPSMNGLSASAIEFGLSALLGAEARGGLSLVLEASQIFESVDRNEFSAFLLFARDRAQIEEPELVVILDRLRAKIPCYVSLFVEGVPGDGLQNTSEVYLSEVPVFQAPLRADAREEERRRDLELRTDKIMPVLRDRLRPTPQKNARSKRA